MANTLNTHNRSRPLITHSPDLRLEQLNQDGWRPREHLDEVSAEAVRDALEILEQYQQVLWRAAMDGRRALTARAMCSIPAK